MEELLWRCVCDSLKCKFSEVQRGLRVDEFVSVLASAIYDSHPAARSLWAPEILKSRLFLLFKRANVDGNDGVSWEDFTTYLLDEASRGNYDLPQSERAQQYQLTRTIHYQKSAAYNPLYGSKPKVNSRQPNVRTVNYLWDKYGTDANTLQQRQNEAYLFDNLHGEVSTNEPIRRMHYFPLWDKVLTCGKFRECRVVSPTDFSLHLGVPAAETTGGTAAGVLAAEYIPDYHSLVTTGTDAKLRFYEIKERNLHPEIELKYTQPVPTLNMVVRWNERLKRLYTADRAGTVVEWNADVEQLLARERQRDKEEEKRRFLIQSGLAVDIPAQKEQKFRLQLRKWSNWHNQPVMDIAFLPKGAIVTASMDTTIGLHDVEVGTTSCTFLGHQSGVLSVSYSRDHQLLFSGGFEFDAFCWNINRPSDRPTRLHDQFDPHQHPLIKVHVVDGAHQVITADCKGKFKIWDIRTLRCMQTFFCEKDFASKGEQEHFYVSDFVHIPSQSKIIASGKNCYFFRCDDKQKVNFASDRPVTAALYNRAFRTFLTVSGQSATVWNATEGMVAFSFSNLVHSPITAACLSPKGSQFWVGTSVGELCVFKQATGELVKNYGVVHKAEISSLTYCEAVGPAPDFVLATSQDGTARIVSKEERIPRSLTFDGEPLLCAAHSIATGLIAIGSAGGAVHCVDIMSFSSRGPVHRSQSSFGEILAIAFLGNLPAFACSDNDGGISVWTVRPYSQGNKMLLRWRNEEKGTLRHPAVVTSLAFNGENNWLVAGDERGRVTVWALAELISEAALAPVQYPFKNVGELLKAMRSTPTTALAADLVTVQSQFTVHTDEVKTLQLILSPACILTAGFDRRVCITGLDGSPWGALLQGRSILSFDRALEPYYFPVPAEDLITREEERWANVEKRIRAFYFKLREAVRTRRQVNRLLFATPVRSLQDESDEEATQLSSPEQTVRETHAETESAKTPPESKRSNSARPTELFRTPTTRRAFLSDMAPSGGSALRAVRDSVHQRLKGTYTTAPGEESVQPTVVPEVVQDASPEPTTEGELLPNTAEADDSTAPSATSTARTAEGTSSGPSPRDVASEQVEASPDAEQSLMDDLLDTFAGDHPSRALSVMPRPPIVPPLPLAAVGLVSAPSNELESPQLSSPLRVRPGARSGPPPRVQYAPPQAAVPRGQGHFMPPPYVAPSPRVATEAASASNVVGGAGEKNVAERGVSREPSMRSPSPPSMRQSRPGTARSARLATTGSTASFPVRAESSLARPGTALGLSLPNSPSPGLTSCATSPTPVPRGMQPVLMEEPFDFLMDEDSHTIYGGLPMAFVTPRASAIDSTTAQPNPYKEVRDPDELPRSHSGFGSAQNLAAAATKVLKQRVAPDPAPHMIISPRSPRTLAPEEQLECSPRGVAERAKEYTEKIKNDVREFHKIEEDLRLHLSLPRAESAVPAVPKSCSSFSGTSPTVSPRGATGGFSWQAAEAARKQSQSRAVALTNEEAPEPAPGQLESVVHGVHLAALPPSQSPAIKRLAQQHHQRRRPKAPGTTGEPPQRLGISALAVQQQAVEATNPELNPSRRADREAPKAEVVVVGATSIVVPASTEATLQLLSATTPRAGDGGAEARTKAFARKKALVQQSVQLQPYQYFNLEHPPASRRPKGGKVGVEKYWLRKGRVKLVTTAHTPVAG